MTQRTEAKVAGVAYLSYIVFALSSVVLSGKAIAGADTPQILSTLVRMLPAARATVLLDLLQIICALVLAATLYRLSKAVDATLALLAMLFRLGEGLLAFLPLLDKLELMGLATGYGGRCAENPACLALANELLKRPDNGLDEFCFVVGGFLFAYLFLAGRLIPRWLAWIGVITIGLQVICVPLQIAGMIPGSIVTWLWIAILPYEIPLAFWLILKGVPLARDHGEV